MALRVRRLALPAKPGKTTLYIRLPGEIIHCAKQFGMIRLWALCRDDCAPERRAFLVLGSNEPIVGCGHHVHVGTVSHDNSVLHVFEVAR